MLRIPSPLSDELETLIYQTIGGCIMVHRALGPGLLESIYARAVHIKAVENLNPVHRAQLISYLRVSGLRIGLLMNFNVTVLQDGIKRLVL